MGSHQIAWHAAVPGAREHPALALEGLERGGDLEGHRAVQVSTVRVAVRMRQSPRARRTVQAISTRADVGSWSAIV